MAKALRTPAKRRAKTPPTREQVAARAYELFLARGGGDGQDVDDWLQAERDLRGVKTGKRSRVT